MREKAHSIMDYNSPGDYEGFQVVPNLKREQNKSEVHLCYNGNHSVIGL